MSPETIYQALYVQGRGHLRADLHQHLRTSGAMKEIAGGSALLSINAGDENIFRIYWRTIGRIRLPERGGSMADNPLGSRFYLEAALGGVVRVVGNTYRVLARLERGADGLRSR